MPFFLILPTRFGFYVALGHQFTELLQYLHQSEQGDVIDRLLLLLAQGGNALENMGKTSVGLDDKVGATDGSEGVKSCIDGEVIRVKGWLIPYLTLVVIRVDGSEEPRTLQALEHILGQRSRYIIVIDKFVACERRFMLLETLGGKGKHSNSQVVGIGLRDVFHLVTVREAVKVLPCIGQP